MSTDRDDTGDGTERTAGARRRIDRRTLLGTGTALAVSGLAGCSFIGGSTGSQQGDCPTPPGDLTDSVPAVYEGATSQGDVERDPTELLARADANYQSSPNGEQRCERCSYYIEDKNEDCLGACVRVAGYVDPDGWCEYYRTEVGGGW